MIRSLILFAMVVFSMGCTHALHQYHAGDGDDSASSSGRKNRTITSLGEQNGFLNFRFNTNYVDEAWQDLQAQCLKGSIVGVHTRFSTSHGFFSWNNQVKMRATCLSSPSVANSNAPASRNY